MTTKEQLAASANYIPPLRFHALTPAYDILVRFTCAEREFRQAMIAALAERSFRNIVDLGCGTGSLLASLCRQFPKAEIVGVDADEAALRLAATKTQHVRSQVSLRCADAGHLPFADGSIEAFTSSLFFHHLEDAAKVKVLREVTRCLAPGGVFVIADWDRAMSLAQRAMFNVVRGLDGFAVTRAHAHGRFAEMIVGAGFATRQVASIPAPLGQITVWRCESSAPR